MVSCVSGAVHKPVVSLSRQRPLSCWWIIFYLKADRTTSSGNEFIHSVEHCFNIPIRTLSLEKNWASSKPAATADRTLRGIPRDVGRDTFIYDFYYSTDDFRARCKEKTGNRLAANLVMTWRWEQAERITPEQRLKAGQKLDLYREWLRACLYKDDNPIIVLPVMKARPKYRGEPPSSPLEAPVAWNQLWLSPIFKTPELTLPIGHIPYRSRITVVNEMLPVGVSIVGLPGTDLSLIEIAQRVLRYSGRPLCVTTGRQMFEEDC